MTVELERVGGVHRTDRRSISPATYLAGNKRRDAQLRAAGYRLELLDGRQVWVAPDDPEA